MESIKNGIYRRYKGNLYEVIGIAKHSETHEEMVLYGEGKIWVRPAKMWNEIVFVDNKQVKRFEFVEQG